MIPGSANPLLLASAAAEPTAYQISRSIRFNSADSAYLSRTPASAGNRKTWTWAGWVKRSGLGAFQDIWGNGDASALNGFLFRFDSGDKIDMYDLSSSVQWRKVTTQVFRDTSAWYHLVISYDTTNATAGDRVRLYVNGERVTAFSSSSDPSLNYDGYINNTNLHAIGRTGQYNGLYLSGYLADIHFIDGQALDPTSFGEFDTNGVWQPKAYTGTYPGNSFHLDFADSATAASLGTDTSGAGNSWTVNNISIGSPAYAARLTSDTTDIVDRTNAFDGSTVTYTSGAVGGTITFTPSPAIQCNSTLRVNMEIDRGQKIFVNGTQLLASVSAGWNSVPVSAPLTISSIAIGPSNAGSSNNIRAIEVDGAILVDSSSQNDSLVDTPTNGSQTDTGAGGEVVGNYCTWNPLAVTPSYQASSLTNGNLDAYVTGNSRNAYSTIAFPASGKYFFEVTLDGSFSGAPIVGVSTFTGTSNAYPSYVTTPSVVYNWDGTKTVNGSTTAYGATYGAGAVIGVAVDIDSSTVTFYKNGASQGSISLSVAGAMPHVGSAGATGTYSLNAGARPFAYTAPSGFKALCTTNLPDPVVAQPSTVMDVKLYTGNGGTQTISGLGFSPDLVWIKARSAVRENRLTDVIRGTTKALYSNAVDAEVTETGGVTAFNSDGFSVGSGNGYNATSETHVAWCFDAGSNTVSNTQGSITSSVRANASAGFSIVTYSGDGSTSGSVGHGLGVSPSMVIIKARNASKDWKVAHVSLAAQNLLTLNQIYAAGLASWDGVTSTVFKPARSGDTYINTSGENYIAYCFAPVAGYSAFGSYVGNGSTDGPFVYTGFRPRWILVKCSSDGSSASDWFIYDSARDSYNAVINQLYPNRSIAEAASSTHAFDLLSNGFKVRSSSTSTLSNGSGQTYIYAAFAESPFAYSRAR